MPEIGEIYNYNNQNYLVTRCEPDSFVVQDGDEEWCDAIEFTDHVAEGETATVTYVMPLDDFEANYDLGEITEGAEPTQLPADAPDEPEAKG